MGEHRIALILLFILCFSVVSISGIGIVKAEETIYIRTDGTVEGTDKIQRDGNVYYTFTSDISGFIVVDKDDVIIDGAGYSLSGKGIGTGINLTERTNITIRNIKISGFENGILLQYYSGNTIFGNKITTNWVGIHLEGSNNSIYENIIENNSIGIEIVGVNNTVFDNVIAYNSHYGIHLAGASYNRVFRNDVVDNEEQIRCMFGASNIYDDGLLGNYWSDYNGIDADNDGIGDEPYIITVTTWNGEVNDTDNYPLMEPTIIPEFQSWLILPLFLIVTLSGIIIRKKFRGL